MSRSQNLLCVALVCFFAATEGALAAPPTNGTPDAVLATNAPAARPLKAPRVLGEEEIRVLLTDAFNQRVGSDAECEIKFTRPWISVTVPDEILKVDIIEPALSRITSSCILRFELRAGRDLTGTYQVPVLLRLWREVLVAHTPLQRGMVLADAPIMRERRDILGVRNPVCELPNDAAAYEISATVPEGTILSAHSIRLKPVVFRGQAADAIVKDGAMQVSLRIEVLEEGAPGQTVRVRNVQSRREFRGKVQDEKTIIIAM